ncbi:MAG: hypothetical protein AAGB04_09670 [Pseudomonadota bacterium]
MPTIAREMIEMTWEEIDFDTISGRRIFKREVEFGNGGYGGQHFELSAEFEVRDAAGRVLLQTSGTAKGDYWCGAFLWFVEGSDGRRVRLHQSHQDDDTYLDVPDAATVSQSTGP